MGAHTGIEWTDATWNPWHGCHKVSQGCKNCYMFRDKARYGQDPNVVSRSKTLFSAPLSWPKKPTLCFTCSWSDWFIEEADPWREEAYAVIQRTPWITYQILTKRIDRAAGRVPYPPLPNIWFGVSAEDQPTLDARVPDLLQTPAAKRFLSYEPALGAIRLDRAIGQLAMSEAIIPECIPALDWVIAGGESGPGARAGHPNWFRSIRDQCVATGIPFFFKQWGEYVDWDNMPDATYEALDASGELPTERLVRVGKKKAGALLDGQEWRQFPS